jgi:hypothetical protein
MSAAEPEAQEGSADAFAIMMRPLTSDASIISPASIGRNDGSLEDPMSGLQLSLHTCQDFSSAYIVKANSSSLPSQMNSVEIHFVISSRIRRGTACRQFYLDKKSL